MSALLPVILNTSVCSAANDLPLSFSMSAKADYAVLLNGEAVLSGHDVALFSNQQWYAYTHSEDRRHNSQIHGPASTGEGKSFREMAALGKLIFVEQMNITGMDVIGTFTGVETHWKISNGDVTFLTSMKQYSALGNVVTFSYNITGEPLVNTYSENATNVITNFPALSLQESVFPSSNASFLSWKSTMVRGDTEKSDCYGTTSGPHVYINDQAPANDADVIIMSYFDHFMSSSQTDTAYNGMRADWIPGISQSVTSLPTNFSQTFIIFYGNRGLTQAMYDWGQLMQSTHSPTGKLVRMPDPTLEYLGYQTDNGAMYCYCFEGCVQKLLDVSAYLESVHVPIRYLSHQGEWWIKGTTSPWCISEWQPNTAYSGMSVSDFQKKFGTPLQLYCPNFCNDTKYAKSNGGEWDMVVTDSSLPECSNFNFKSPSPTSSAKFYNWLFEMGISMGMESFEIDFLNQNYNCVPALRESPEAIEMWMQGLHEAAVQQNQPMQWCMATPTHALASLHFPAVTNFRAGGDFKGGHSYDIGISSLFIWALGAAPSKDTFWTTDNMPLAPKIGGCEHNPCPPDHTNISLELHTILAILSTGPVGFSDAPNMTNASLIMRTCQQNGTLLKPAKAATIVDASFSTSRAPAGSVYGTYCGNSTLAVAFLLVSFSMQDSWQLTIADLWSPSGIPRPSGGGLPVFITFVYRLRWNHPICISNTSSGNCVETAHLMVDDASSKILDIPAQIDSKEHHLAPCLTAVWPVFCPNGWVLLGELSKYVPLAESRFPAFYQCTEAGLSTTVRGEPGEVVSVTALGPEGISAAGMAYVKDVTIDKTGLVSLTFE